MGEAAVAEVASASAVAASAAVAEVALATTVAGDSCTGEEAEPADGVEEAIEAMEDGAEEDGARSRRRRRKGVEILRGTV
jgi:hypothetical protein